MSEIRTGKISSINYQSGMVRATYTDKNNATSGEMPYLNNGNEYNMPNVGDDIITMQLSNGDRSIALGTYWNKGNQPKEGNKGVYRKELSDKSYIRCDLESEEYRITAKTILLDATEIVLKDENYSITLTDLMKRIEALEQKMG